MFDRTRAQLQPQIDAQQQVLAEALALRDAAQGQVDAVVAAVVSAQARLASAQAALTKAQDALAAAQTNRDTARAQRAAAAQAVTDWLDAEPENPLPNGHPNPAWRPWKLQLDQREADLDAKQTALTNDENALAAAATARDAATTQVSTAQGAVASAQEPLPAAQDRLRQTQPAIVKAESDLAELFEVPSELDAREARILAEPLNRTDLELASDAEMLAAFTRRHTRHDLWIQRLQAVKDRGATLSAHDATADDLAALASIIRSWPGAGTDPDLNAVAAALEGIAQDSRTNRMFGAESRSDDLGAVTATLMAQARTISTLLAAANAQRDAAGVALQRSGEALATINKQAPKK
jgi:chromosome segregation ATPase